MAKGKCGPKPRQNRVWCNQGPVPRLMVKSRLNLAGSRKPMNRCLGELCWSGGIWHAAGAGCSGFFWLTLNLSFIHQCWPCRATFSAGNLPPNMYWRHFYRREFSAKPWDDPHGGIWVGWLHPPRLSIHPTNSRLMVGPAVD